MKGDDKAPVEMPKVVRVIGQMRRHPPLGPNDRKCDSCGRIGVYEAQGAEAGTPPGWVKVPAAGSQHPRTQDLVELCALCSKLYRVAPPAHKKVRVR